MTGTQATGLPGELAGRLAGAGLIRTDPVRRAFGAVPRHLFLPGTTLAQAYADEAVVTKWDADGRPLSSSSQPAIMAIMLEQLAVAAGQRVLEIGTGTGYNAALLAHLAGESGAVTSIELDPAIAGAARERLLGAGGASVRVVAGDGASGWPDGGPYDRIIVTASAADLAPAWREQLAPHGRIVLPLSLYGAQQSVAFAPAGDHLASTEVTPCGFMPLRGALAGPDGERVLLEPGVFIRLRDGRAVDTAALAAALGSPGQTVGSGVRMSGPELFGGLRLWLGLREKGAGEIAAVGEAAGRGLIPAVITTPGMELALVLAGEGALAALARAGDGEAEEFEVAVRGFGEDSERLVARLAAHIRAWHAAGRPSAARLRIRAYPAGTGESEPAAAVVAARHTRFLLDW